MKFPDYEDNMSSPQRLAAMRAETVRQEATKTMITKQVRIFVWLTGFNAISFFFYVMVLLWHHISHLMDWIEPFSV